MAFRLVQPEMGASFEPEILAKEIREAVGRGASALLVDPIQEPVVVDALHAAVERGTAVLLLDRPVASRKGRSIPFIRYGPIPDAGAQIVRGALDAVALFHRKEPGRIILLHHQSDDSYGDEQLSSLADPLRAAGKSFTAIDFQVDANQAVELLKKSLAADPKLALVLADDRLGMNAAYSVMTEWTRSNHDAFLFAGFVSYDIRTPNELFSEATFYGDRSVESLGIKAFQTIQRLLEEKPVGHRIDVPIGVHKKPVLFVPTPENSERAPSSPK